MHKIFIDGQAGTTGLEIANRLKGREDLEIITIDPELRKSQEARYEAFAQADIAILCLPDDAAREAVDLTRELPVRIIDASTAHRIDPVWVYGFPELCTAHDRAIHAAKYVANPGCFATGAIAIVAPLRQEGLIPSNLPLAISAVSGFSGGGKAMIEGYEAGQMPDFFLYGTGQRHKHLPEITHHCALERAPHFMPSVANYLRGMAVQIPLNLADLGMDFATLHAAYEAHYAQSVFVTVHAAPGSPERIDPQMHNGTNHMSLHLCGDEACGRVTVIACLDNLGKGSSGAAVQNLNIMMDVPQERGL